MSTKKSKKQSEQVISFYFDDAGIFHTNSNDEVFVYAGMYFLNENEYLKIHNKFLAFENHLRNIKIYKNLKEIKASKVKREHKKQIFNITDFSSIILVATYFYEINPEILSKKESIGRFKDYMIKKIIRNTLEKLIIENKIDTNQKLTIRLRLDQQTNKSNGYYDLTELILADLKGISNPEFNDVLISNVEITTKYLNSRHTPVIRVCDFVANLSFNYLNSNETDNINQFLKRFYKFIFVPWNQIKKIK
ncbi:DUF3800 domain-containing protein [Mesomycoplasma hyorhinis]|uniref:DUF3800 domain-containing protein n=1 Tax=Mesomycoplasma hyorhinis TaxID=2100 RepID=UPI001C0511C2|nr:DUF3800 domain-containing protein [Mesomycoplasma hyorhinis]